MPRLSVRVRRPNLALMGPNAEHLTLTAQFFASEHYPSLKDLHRDLQMLVSDAYNDAVAQYERADADGDLDGRAYFIKRYQRAYELLAFVQSLQLPR